MGLKKTVFGHSKKGGNTFIGGIGGTINTKSLLASKLGISATNITKFKVTDNNIECFITGNYSLGYNVFYNNTTITYYIDNDRLVQAITNGSFFGCTNLEVLELYGLKTFSSGGLSKIYGTKIQTLYFPEMLTIEGNSSINNNSLLTSIDIPNATTSNHSDVFRGNIALTYVNIPKVANKIGLNSGYNLWFYQCAYYCVINVHVNMLVNDAGNPDGDLVAAKLQRNAVVNFYDDSGNYVSTL